MKSLIWKIRTNNQRRKENKKKMRKNINDCKKIIIIKYE